MEQIVQSFKPVNGGVTGTAQITIAATTAQVALPLSAGQSTVRVYNGGTAVVFVCFGTAAGAAAVAATSMPIPGGGVEVFTIDPVLVNNGLLYVACIGSVGGVLYATPGIGA